MTDPLREEIELLTNRVRLLEAWRALALDLLDHAADDVIKLEEYAEEDRLRMDDQAVRIARLELSMGIVFIDKETKG